MVEYITLEQAAKAFSFQTIHSYGDCMQMLIDAVSKGWIAHNDGRTRKGGGGMSNLWRFYDGNFSGVVVAWTEKEALERANLYLKIHFNGYEESASMKVWPCKKDDDFDEAVPWALAVSY